MFGLGTNSYKHECHRFSFQITYLTFYLIVCDSFGFTVRGKSISGGNVLYPRQGVLKCCFGEFVATEPAEGFGK